MARPFNPPASSIETLGELTDVDTTGVAGLDVLSYDADASQWSPRALATSAGAIGNAPALLDTFALAGVSRLKRYSDQILFASTATALHVLDWSSPTLGEITSLDWSAHFGTGAVNHLSTFLGYYLLAVGQNTAGESVAVLVDVSNPFAPSIVNARVADSGIPFAIGGFLTANHWLQGYEGGFGLRSREWSPAGLTDAGGGIRDQNSTDTLHLDVFASQWVLTSKPAALFNLEDPTAWVRTDTLLGAAGTYKFFDGQYIVSHSADGAPELQVWDWSDPSNITEVGAKLDTSALGVNTGGLAIINSSYAVVAGNQALGIVDWSDPAAPVFAGTVTGLAELGNKALIDCEYRPGAVAVPGSGVVGLYDTTATA